MCVKKWKIEQMREKNEENAPSTKYVFVASECYEEFPFVCMGLGISMGMQ